MNTIIVKMIPRKDAQILFHLRNNARKKITHISKGMGVPVTTIYDRIRSHQKKGIVKKHVTLLDFSKLGYNTTALIAMRIDREKRSELRDYLSKHPNVNSLYRVDVEHDFLVEMVFENMAKLHDFTDDAQDKFQIEELKIFNVIEELKKEEFLTKPEHFELV